uniref:Methyltransferase type 11 domain-containing protein n=1 Tax=Leptobrachium leishanense TaxID=445787 RepID=A0A8C5RB86_9ANUR
MAAVKRRYSVDMRTNPVQDCTCLAEGPRRTLLFSSCLHISASYTKTCVTYDCESQDMEKEASRLERAHVHSVYEQIAPYFNDKRYKAWPKVQEFILAQESGSLIADIGCGNGKYLHINSQTFKVGCDYCSPLAESARSRGFEIMVCDGLNLPYRTGCFDAALSISVIHHFSTKERRIRAIREISRILKVGGKVMIYVWAKEQKRRKFEKQDILVPWNLEPSSPDTSQETLKWHVEQDARSDPSQTPPVTEDEAITIHGRGKRCSFEESKTPDRTFRNLSRSNILSKSLDTGLDVDSHCENNNQKYHGLLHRFYDYCVQTTVSKTGIPFDLSKPGNFLRQLGDFFPKPMQHSDRIKASAHPPCKSSTACSSNSEYSTSANVVDTFGKDPLPDLVSNQESYSAVLKHCSTKHPGLRSDFKSQCDSDVDSESERVAEAANETPSRNTKCFRYYHIFKRGELKELIDNYVPELYVVKTFFDHSNWCVVAEKVQSWKI